jgi:hypothetical protein
MADKKISQLPKINTISGSTVILPIVHDGTTQQMDVSTFAVYTSQWSADTGSNTFFGNQIISGNLSVSGISTLTGNTSIGGNLEVGGMITAQQYNVTYVSSSVQYQSGSTEFGDTADDVHTFTGTLNLNGLAVGTSELMAQTASQDGVNLRISSVTGSINTTTSSFDSVFLGISSVTGAINTTTASFDSVFLGISSFTGSLNSLTGSYATTGSNTFRANQAITGSLSISAGEFNVTTGSGNMTSSLRFDHTQNNGVTLQLSHDNNTANADHAFNVNVWSAGVYTEFVRNGTPYSILNVEAFDDNKIYLYRDTRLYNKSLVIDNNLTVQKDVVIGTGSLDINNGEFSITSGSGELTSSLSFTHTTVDPITGNATLALRYRNNDVGPENNAWRFVADDGGVKLSYDQYATSNKLLFSVSSLGSNFDKLLIWRDARLYGKGLTVDDSLLVKGVITGSLLATNGVVSSSNQLFELNQQTGSQGNLNAQIGISTSSLNFTTGALNLFTGSVIGQTNTISTFTASVNFTTQSLNIQTGSQESINTTLSIVTGSMRAEIGGIEAYTASLKDAIIVNGTNVRIVGELTASRIYTEFITSSVLFVTGSNIIGDQSTDKHEFTGSVNLKNGLFVEDYSKFGKSGLDKALDVFGRIAVTGSVTTQANSIGGFVGSYYLQWDSFGSQGGDAQASVGYYVGASNDDRKLRITSDRDIQLNHGNGIGRKIQIPRTGIGLGSVVELTGSLNITGSSDIIGNLAVTSGGITGSMLATNGVISSSQQITNYYKFAETASANTTFYGGLIVTDYSKFGKSGVDKALDIFGRIAVTGSVSTQQNTIGGFIGNFYNQWDSFGSQGGDGAASVGYFVGAQNDDRKLRLTSDSDIQLNHGYNKKIQITRNFISDARVELTGSLLATGSSAIIGNLAVTLGGITGSILATNGVLSGSSQISELTQIPGIMALTASMKAAAIVSSSQQITNYYKFAETASANIFYGDQTITGSLAIKDSETDFLIEGNGFSQTYLTSNGAIILNPGYGGVEMVGSYRTFKATDITADGTLLVKGSTTLGDDSADTTIITGSLNVTGSITITSGSITMPHRPAFRLVGDGGSIIAPYVISGSRVTMDYNQGNHYNPTNGLFTAPIAGLYQVNLVVRTHSNTNSTINQAIVFKSGSNTNGDVAQIMVEYGINTTMNHAGGSTISKLEVGDTLKVLVAVGTCSFDGNDNFSVAYIG